MDCKLYNIYNYKITKLDDKLAQQKYATTSAHIIKFIHIFTHGSFIYYLND